MSLRTDKKVILAIDDVALNLATIKNLLSREFDVRIAKSGELALFILGTVKVDLILLDIEMPNMSGFDFMSFLLDIPEAQGIPVIFVTSHAGADTIRKALMAGAKDYIVKPFKGDVMREKVFKALNMRPGV